MTGYRSEYVYRGFHLADSVFDFQLEAEIALEPKRAGLKYLYMAVELGLVALYYNLRWAARYVLVARRSGGGA